MKSKTKKVAELRYLSVSKGLYTVPDIKHRLFMLQQGLIFTSQLPAFQFSRHSAYRRALQLARTLQTFIEWLAGSQVQMQGFKELSNFYICAHYVFFDHVRIVIRARILGCKLALSPFRIQTKVNLFITVLLKDLVAEKWRTLYNVRFNNLYYLQQRSVRTIT
jgi:hypothetical protein